jgi:hypothetical protein
VKNKNPTFHPGTMKKAQSRAWTMIRTANKTPEGVGFRNCPARYSGEAHE